MPRTSAAARLRPRPPHGDSVHRPSGSQSDSRCGGRFRSRRRRDVSSLHFQGLRQGLSTPGYDSGTIMPLGCTRINILCQRPSLRSPARTMTLGREVSHRSSRRSLLARERRFCRNGFDSRHLPCLNPLPCLIPTPFDERVRSGIDIKQGSHLPETVDDRISARGDLAWAISVGGIGVVAFAALLLFTWYFAATLFLIFAGMLLGVALNAMTNLLGRVIQLPHALRLTIVCLVLAGLLSGVVFLGGSTIAQQAKVLSDTIKSQLVGVKAFLEKNGIDTSYLELGNPAAAPEGSTTATPGAAPARNLPSDGADGTGG